MQILKSRSPEKTCVQILFIIFVSVGLTACGDRPDADTVQMDTTALPVDTMGMNMEDEAMGSDTVEVAVVDFEIDMPTTLPGGLTVFEVTNDGTTEHNFEIEGQGIEQEFPQNLTAGETRTMEVDLQPGTYTIYCPVADHRSRGMELELSVEPAQGGILGN